MVKIISPFFVDHASFGVKHSVITQPRMGRNILTMGGAHRREPCKLNDSPERAKSISPFQGLVRCGWPGTHRASPCVNRFRPFRATDKEFAGFFKSET